jgi:hypothetical protein
MRKSLFSHRQYNLRKVVGSAFGSMLILLLMVSTGSAFQVDTGTDVKIAFDNTVKYSMGFRVQDQESDLISNANTDDGDRNFDTGLMSSRFDLLSEMDIVYKNIGVRVSGTAWYDTIYHGDTDHDSPATSNNVSEPYDEFTDDTTDLHGGDVELLDLFAFASGKLGGKPASIRAGRHTLLWGETLFFAGNGIAAGQAPMDIIKMLGVPGTKAKELFLPVAQVSGQVQLAKGVTLASYYQLEWRESHMPGAGSYFSDVDIIDEGGEKLITPGGNFYRRNDMEGDDTGQYGISLRFNPGSDLGIGLYYLNYHQKNQYWTYTDTSTMDLASGRLGDYYLVYPEDIQMIGMSISGQVGLVNVCAEVSARFDAPLISETGDATLMGDNRSNNLYALGDTFHANLSAIGFLQPTFLWQGGSFLAEVAYEDLMSIEDNRDMIDDARDEYAWGIRMVFEPAYYQVFPGYDIRVPIGFAYTGNGASPSDLKFNGGAVDGGDVSIGVNVDYRTEWKFGVKYTMYYGDDEYQTLEDRDFISFSMEHTF